MLLVFMRRVHEYETRYAIAVFRCEDAHSEAAKRCSD
jgi:hypothetical protein